VPGSVGVHPPPNFQKARYYNIPFVDYNTQIQFAEIYSGPHKQARNQTLVLKGIERNENVLIYRIMRRSRCPIRDANADRRAIQ
jgi:hypothetical protein